MPANTRMAVPNPTPGTPLNLVLQSYYAPAPTITTSTTCGPSPYDTVTNYKSTIPASVVLSTTASGSNYYQLQSGSGKGTGVAPTGTGTSKDGSLTWVYISPALPTVAASANPCSGNIAYNQIIFGTGAYEDGSVTGSLGLNIRTVLAKGFLIGYHYSGGGNISASDTNYEPAGGQNDYASVGAWLDDPGVEYTKGATYTAYVATAQGVTPSNGSLIRSSGQFYAVTQPCTSTGNVGPSGTLDGSMKVAGCFFTSYDPTQTMPTLLSQSLQVLHNFKGHGGKLNGATFDLFNDANAAVVNSKGVAIKRGPNAYDHMVERGPGNGPLIYQCGADLWFSGVAGDSPGNQIQVCGSSVGPLLGDLVIEHSALPNTVFTSDTATYTGTTINTYGTISTNVVIGGYNDLTYQTNINADPAKLGAQLPSPYNDQMGTTTTANGTSFATPIGVRQVVVTGNNVAIGLPPAPNPGDQVCYSGGTTTSYVASWSPTPSGSATGSLILGQQECFVWSGVGGWLTVLNSKS